MLAGENFLQPAAAKVGAPPRSKFGGSEKLPAPPAHVAHPADRDARRADFHKCLAHNNKPARRANELT
jgi:hypothetical protein